MLSETHMRNLASRLVREGLNMIESWRFDKAPDIDASQALALKPDVLEQMQQQCRADIAASRYDRTSLILDRLLAKTSAITVAKGTPEYQNLARHFAISMLQFLEIETERRKGNYGNSFDKSRYDLSGGTPQKQAEPSKPCNKTSPHISMVISSYVDERISGARWDVKTRQQNESSLSLMLEIIGDQPISAVTHQRMMELRDVLKRLPANRSKGVHYRSKSIEAILRLKNIKPMSITTINNILTRIASFFHWSEIHEYIEKSPARHLMLPTSKRADEERSIYSTAELQFLLDAIAEQSHPISHPERIWLVLIALYSGMRPNEAAQLYLDDVVTEDGVLCFRVNDGHRDQKVKNQRARRIVPVHSLLIDFGFEKYHRSVSHNPSKRLFPKLKHHRDGYHAYYGRWLQKLNRQNVTEDKTKTFYSLRHNFVTALKQAGVDFTVIAEIVGHTVPGETLGRYGKANKPCVLLEALQKLSYKVNLDKIHQAAIQTYRK